MTSRFCSIALIFFAATTGACSGVVRDTRGSTDVSGTVVNLDTQTPVAGAQVLVGDTLTSTDELGHFTIPDVTPPYDVAVTVPGDNSASVYLGVESTAQRYRLQRYRAVETTSSVNGGTVTVTLPAADTPDVVGVVQVELLDNLTYQAVSWDAAAMAPGAVRTYAPAWLGATNVNVRVHAFQYQVDPATGAPLHYIGYDTIDTVLDAGATFAWSVSWKPPPFPESTLSFTVSLPEGYTSTSSMLGMLQGASATGIQLAKSKAQGPEVSFVVPGLPGVSFWLQVGATGSGGDSLRSVRGISADTKGLVVQVDPAPTLMTPAAGATIGAGSTVTWSGGEGAAYIVLGPDGSEPLLAGPLYFLYSGGSPATIPDLSALGAALPPGTLYTVMVQRDSAVASVEGLAENWLVRTDDLPWTLAQTFPRKVTTR